MFQKKTKEDDPEKLTHGHVFAYGMGALPANMNNQLRSSYQLSFMTDIAKINPAIAGALMTIMVIWDAINDPIIAVLADRTNTKRMGKYYYFVLCKSGIYGSHERRLFLPGDVYLLLGADHVYGILAGAEQRYECRPASA